LPNFIKAGARKINIFVPSEALPREEVPKAASEPLEEVWENFFTPAKILFESRNGKCFLQVELMSKGV